MLYPHKLRECAGIIRGSGMNESLLADDLWRLRNSFLGAISGPVSGGGRPLIVYLGARSGLEAILALHRWPGATVLVVDSNPETRERLEQIAGDTAALRCVPDIVTARAATDGRRIDFLRVESTMFTPDVLDTLLDGRRCGHLCGTFAPDQTLAIALYRASRDRYATSFFWRDDTTRQCFGSDRGPVDVEVSVVVPAFKVSAEIDQCLEGLAHQTLERLEVLVIDDGSPDDCGEKAQRWADRFPGRVRVVRKENGGCAAARMTGIKLARGEFVGFVDGDDWVDTSMYEQLYAAAAVAGAEIAQCGFAEVFSDGSRVIHRDAWPEPGEPVPVTVFDAHRYMIQKPTIWRRIYRRDFVLGNGLQFPEHIRRFDDLPFQFEALAQTKRMVAIPDPYYAYRQGRPGQDIAVRDDRLFVHFPIFDWLRQRVTSWAGARVEAQLVRVELNTHLWALGRIERKFRTEYRARSQAQFLRNRVHLGPLHLLRIALPMGRKAVWFVAAALLRHGGKIGHWDEATAELPPAARRPVAPA